MSERTSTVGSWFRSGSALVGALLVAAGVLGLVGLGAAGAWNNDGPQVAADWAQAGAAATVSQTTQEQVPLAETLRNRTRSTVRDRTQLTDGLCDECAATTNERTNERVLQRYGGNAATAPDECPAYSNGTQADGVGPGMMQRSWQNGATDNQETSAATGGYRGRWMNNSGA